MAHIIFPLWYGPYHMAWSRWPGSKLWKIWNHCYPILCHCWSIRSLTCCEIYLGLCRSVYEGSFLLDEENPEDTPGLYLLVLEEKLEEKLEDIFFNSSPSLYSQYPFQFFSQASWDFEKWLKNIFLMIFRLYFSHQRWQRVTLKRLYAASHPNFLFPNLGYSMSY